MRRFLFLLAAIAGPAWSQGAFPANLGSSGGGGGGGYSSSSSTYTAGTWYFPVVGSDAANTVEAAVQLGAPVAGNYSNLIVGIYPALPAGDTFVFTFRDGGVSQAGTCSVAAAASVCSDFTHSFQPAQGDLLAMQAVLSGPTAYVGSVSFAYATPGLTGPAGAPGSAGAAGSGYAATSATSNTVGTGSMTFTTQAGLAYSTASRARAASHSGPTNYVEGQVTSYSGTSLVINVDTTGGSGTKTDWDISLVGSAGAGGYFSQLQDFAVTRTSGTVLTMNVNPSGSVIGCTQGNNIVVTTASTLTLTAGSGASYAVLGADCSTNDMIVLTDATDTSKLTCVTGAGFVPGAGFNACIVSADPGAVPVNTLFVSFYGIAADSFTSGYDLRGLYDTDGNSVVQKWNGSGPPGNLPYSLTNDTYADTSGSTAVLYICTASAGACNGVSAGQWALASGGLNGSGNNAYCADATGSTTTYTCPSSSPTVSTLTGLFVAFVPQTTNTGAATLSVAGMAAKALKESDCATDIPAGGLIGGTIYLFSYNGTLFCQSSVATGNGTQSSELVLPELAANGANTTTITAPDNQSASGCTQWPQGASTAGQVAVDSGTTETKTDGKVCRVFTWQTPSGGGGHAYKDMPAGYIVLNDTSTGGASAAVNSPWFAYHSSLMSPAEEDIGNNAAQFCYQLPGGAGTKAANWSWRFPEYQSGNSVALTLWMMDTDATSGRTAVQNLKIGCGPGGPDSTDNYTYGTASAFTYTSGSTARIVAPVGPVTMNVPSQCSNASLWTVQVDTTTSGSAPNGTYVCIEALTVVN